MSDSKLQDAVQRLGATHRRNVEKVGPFLRNSVLGEIVGEMAERGTWPTVGELKAEVTARIANSPSSLGRMAIEDDAFRAPLEHVRMLLERLECSSAVD